MGYGCPVCDAPQADGTHLANHLAFAAMLHGGEHEAWLDEHVPGWADRDPDGLAADVVEHAEEVEHETVFEDTLDGGGAPDAREPVDVDALDPAARRAVEAARELERGDRTDRSDEE